MSRTSRKIRRARARVHHAVPQPAVKVPPAESRWWWVKGLGLSLGLLGFGTGLMYAAVASVEQATAGPALMAQAASAPTPAGTPLPTSLPTPPPPRSEQRVAKLQYSLDSGATWRDLPPDDAPVVADEGEPIGLRAVKLKPHLPWPRTPLLPVWRNGHDRHWGEIIYVKYDETMGPAEAHVVSATCGNTVAARIAARPLYELTCSASKKRAVVAAPGTTTTQAQVIVVVRRFKGAPAAGVPVRITATDAAGAAAGTLRGAGANGQATTDGTAITDAQGRAVVALTGVSQPGEVHIAATLVQAGVRVLTPAHPAVVLFEAPRPTGGAAP